MSGKNAVDFSSLIDNDLPIPEHFKVKKIKEGWELTWSDTPLTVGNSQYVVLVFVENSKNGYDQKVFTTTNDSRTFIPVKPGFNPAKVIFGVFTVGRNDFHSPVSKMFKIKRNRLSYIN